MDAVQTASDLWDHIDLVKYHLDICSNRQTSDVLHLKSEDMSTMLSTFKSRLLDCIEHIGYYETIDDELWDTFKIDMNNMCSMLKSSLRITFVENITCTDVDRMAVNLFVATEAILSDWTKDFYGDNFEVDEEGVWLAYKKLLFALSLFCDTGRCEESLMLQYDLNIKQKRAKNKKQTRGIAKGGHKKNKKVNWINKKGNKKVCE